MNQDIDDRDFGKNSSRSREFEVSNSPSSNFNDMQIDFDEFRPIQVIDYQNKKPIPVSFVNQPSFVNQSTFANIIPPNVRKQEEVFLRKIVEYDHKSKIHPWNWFCPVIQIEYNHTKNGISLHEHPPPKSIKPEPEQRNNPQLEQRIKQELATRDHFPLRHPKWQQNERQERVGDRYHPSDRYSHHQSRYENRQLPNDMQSYSRRNPQEKSWLLNYQESNTHQSNYGHNR